MDCSAKPRCFLCLTEVEPDLLSELENLSSTDCLQYLLHHFKIDIQQLLNENKQQLIVLLHSQMVGEGGTNELKLELCTECFCFTRQFSEMYQKLERIQLLMTPVLKLIHRKFMEAEEAGKRKLDFVDMLRSEAVEKCARQLSVAPTKKFEISKVLLSQVVVDDRISPKNIEIDGVHCSRGGSNEENSELDVQANESIGTRNNCNLNGDPEPDVIYNADDVGNPSLESGPSFFMNTDIGNEYGLLDNGPAGDVVARILSPDKELSFSSTSSQSEPSSIYSDDDSRVVVEETAQNSPVGRTRTFSLLLPYENEDEDCGWLQRRKRFARKWTARSLKHLDLDSDIEEEEESSSHVKVSSSTAGKSIDDADVSNQSSKSGKPQTESSRSRLRTTYSCPVCKKSFTNQSNLEMHKLSHENDEWQVTEAGSGDDDDDDAASINSQIPKSPDIITSVQAGNIGYQNRKWRLDPETGEYNCGRCSAKYRSKRGVEQHYTTLHVKLSYKCKSCRKKFRSRASYYEHYESAHFVENTKCSKIYL